MLPVMTKIEHLLSALHGDRVDTDEFINELTAYFGLARTDEETVTFPGKGPTALQADFDKEGALVRLVPGSAFDETMQAALEERIRTRLVEDVGTALRAHTLFASRPVTGHYRHPSGGMQIPAIATACASPRNAH